MVHRFELRETLARLLDLLLRPDRAAQALACRRPPASPTPSCRRYRLEPLPEPARAEHAQ